MMQMLGAFAEYEREMVKERTQAGLKAARAQGRHGGRRPKFRYHVATSTTPDWTYPALVLTSPPRDARASLPAFRLERRRVGEG